MSKIGNETLVNTQTVGDQTLAQTAKLNSGGYVTVWVDWADSNFTEVADGSWSGIKAQVFGPSGNKSGPEIVVNTAALNWQQDPHVAVLANGNFVVTWTDGWDYFTYADHPGSLGVGGAGGDDSGKAIKAQVFDAGGSPIGKELLVNSDPRSDQTGEKVVALANGNFVITWEDWTSSCVYDANGKLDRCGGGPSIMARIFDPTGKQVGNELLVAGDHNYTPKIATLSDGGFVVVWHDGHYSVDDVMAQVFSATGTMVGQQIRVNTTGKDATFSTQNEEQVVGLSNGGFAVVWTDLNGDASGRGVKTQVFNALGERVGGELLVNTTTQADQLHPQVTALKGGGFVVAWDDWSDGIDVGAQMISNLGDKLGSEILVNSTKGGAQDGVQIGALDDGGFVVTWAENWRDVKYQTFDANGVRVGPETYANTVLAGDQSGAQITGLNDGAFVIAWNDGGYGPSDGSGSAVKSQLFANDKTMTGTASNDILAGGPGMDLLKGGPGNDMIDGGAGIDTAGFSAQRANYAVTKTANGWTVGDSMGNDGNDTLANVERLQFSDKKLALDLGIAEHGGLALQFIGLMAPEMVSVPDIVGTILTIFDQGKTMQQVCQLAIDVGLVTAIAGANTNQALAAMAYKNLLGAPAGADAIDMLVGYMDGRSANYTQTEFMTVVAGLELNQTHIGLVGLAQTGVEFL